MSKKRAPSPLGDLLFGSVARLSALLTLALLVGVMVVLIISAWPSIETFGVGFLTSMEWDYRHERFSALLSLLGTVASSLIAVLIAVPISFGIALFLTELSPKWLRQPLTVAIELLAAIPSIVYGMWGALVFAPWFGANVLVPLQKMLVGVPVLEQLFSGSSASRG